MHPGLMMQRNCQYSNPQHYKSMGDDHGTMRGTIPCFRLLLGTCVQKHQATVRFHANDTTMASSRLTSLPREVRDIVIQHYLDLPQAELDFAKPVYLSTDLLVFSSESVAPAKLLSTCQQLREETLYLMDPWDKTPRPELHMLRTLTTWELCTAWKVPPSACARFHQRKIEYMYIDLKPRSSAGFKEQVPCAGVPQKTSNQLPWYNDLLSCDEAGDRFGCLIGQAVQSLRNNQHGERTSQGIASSHGYSVYGVHHDPDVILDCLRFDLCQEDNCLDTILSESTKKDVQKGILTTMYRSVSSTIACC